MKNFFTAIALASLSIGSMSGEILNPVSIDNSGCFGSPLYAPSSDDDTEDNHYQYKWNIQYQDGMLIITWRKLAANCCNIGFSTWIDIKDDSTIEFNAKSIEDETICDCICTYDVTSSYENIKPGHYTILFHDATWSDSVSEIFKAEIDITEGCDINLSKAPSGVYAISTDNPIVTVSPEGLIHISSDEIASLEIYDAGGTLHTRLHATPNSDIDISNLRKGVYIAKITISGKTSTLRFAR